mgnify:CR=1 FL=1
MAAIATAILVSQQTGNEISFSIEYLRERAPKLPFPVMVPTVIATTMAASPTASSTTSRRQLQAASRRNAGGTSGRSSSLMGPLRLVVERLG